MNIEVVAPERLGAAAAGAVAQALRSAVGRRGRCAVAFSGGRTPRAMLDALVGEDVPWDAVEVFQTDERFAPAGHPERNLTMLADHLLERVPLPTANVHPMPVGEDDPEVAPRRYARHLTRACGDPPVLDVVHLGLGADGHTASLFPGDPAAEVTDVPVTATRSHAGRRRLTLTLPTFDRARAVVWLVAGGDKAEALQRLVAGDPTVPAGRVRSERAVVWADSRAAAGLEPGRAD